MGMGIGSRLITFVSFFLLWQLDHTQLHLNLELGVSYNFLS
jgi:hypothetical protein